jgi:short-subunit dehydrogenase
MKTDVGRDVTILINNAGIVAGKPFFENNDAYAQKVRRQVFL